VDSTLAPTTTGSTYNDRISVRLALIIADAEWALHRLLGMATILIVDDLPANRRFLVTLLRDQGHRLLEAADGREGLAVVQAPRRC
jgi:PleD family two-component response regulator